MKTEIGQKRAIRAELRGLKPGIHVTPFDSKLSVRSFGHQQSDIVHLLCILI